MFTNPYDEFPTCDKCNRDPAECTCKECPLCGVVGDTRCGDVQCLDPIKTGAAIFSYLQYKYGILITDASKNPQDPRSHLLLRLAQMVHLGKEAMQKEFLKITME